MNWDLIEGDWMQFKDKVRKLGQAYRRGPHAIGGRRETDRPAAGAYGFAKAEAAREIEAWVKAQRRAA